MIAVLFEAWPREGRADRYFDIAAAWRTSEHHRAAQAEGRDAIFADYRLRIAAVIRDYGMQDRGQAPG